MPIRLALPLFPLLEIAGFVWIGGYLGVGGTLAFVLLSTITGISLLRTEGIRLLLGLHAAREAGRPALAQLLDGAGRIISAVLLVIPGFFSTAFGLLLLIPPVRLAVLRWLGRQATWTVSEGTRPGAATVIEAEFHDVDGPAGQLPRQPPPL
jgi:UPF0716 protein FxsA